MVINILFEIYISPEINISYYFVFSPKIIILFPKIKGKESLYSSLFFELWDWLQRYIFWYTKNLKNSDYFWIEILKISFYLYWMVQRVFLFSSNFMCAKVGYGILNTLYVIELTFYGFISNTLLITMYSILIHSFNIYYSQW